MGVALGHGHNSRVVAFQTLLGPDHHRSNRVVVVELLMLGPGHRRRGVSSMVVEISSRLWIVLLLNLLILFKLIWGP